MRNDFNWLDLMELRGRSGMGTGVAMGGSNGGVAMGAYR